MRNFVRRMIAGAAIVALTAFSGATNWPTGTQALARGDLEALAGAGKVVLSGSDPGWGTTNGQAATVSDFTTYFKHNTCSGSSTQGITSAVAQACAVITSVHTPILANNSFVTNISPWTTSGSGGCQTQPFAYNGTTFEDSAGSAMAGSGAGTGGTPCTSSVQTITQTFTISGTPTAQSGSLYYYAYSQYDDGGGTCGGDSGGTVYLQIVTNSTTVTAYGSALSDTNGWHQVTFTPALVNGSNTISISLKMTSQTVTGGGGCTTITHPNQPGGIDNVVLTATY